MEFISPSQACYVRKNWKVEANWEPLFYANARKKRNSYAFNVNAHKSLSRVHVNATVCPEHDLHHSLRRWVMKERSGDCSQWSLQRSRLPLFASAELRTRTCARTHTHIHTHTHTHTHTHARTHARTHAHTHTHARTHTCTYCTYNSAKWVISLLSLYISSARS